MNWYIGQRVVWTIDNNEYTIEGIRKSTCRCPYDELDVGIRGFCDGNYCSDCKSTYHDWTDVDWKCSSLFRPLESTYTEEEIESVNIDELVQPEMEPA